MSAISFFRSLIFFCLREWPTTGHCCREVSTCGKDFLAGGRRSIARPQVHPSCTGQGGRPAGRFVIMLPPTTYDTGAYAYGWGWAAYVGYGLYVRAISPAPSTSLGNSSHRISAAAVVWVKRHPREVPRDSEVDLRESPGSERDQACGGRGNTAEGLRRIRDQAGPHHAARCGRPLKATGPSGVCRRAAYRMMCMNVLMRRAARLDIVTLLIHAARAIP
jgi:hypothetical protein